MEINKSKLHKAVNDYLSKATPGFTKRLMYDTADGDVWVDELAVGESKRYHSDTIHQFCDIDFDYWAAKNRSFFGYGKPAISDFVDFFVEWTGCTLV